MQKRRLAKIAEQMQITGFGRIQQSVLIVLTCLNKEFIQYFVGRLSGLIHWIEVLRENSDGFQDCSQNKHLPSGRPLFGRISIKMLIKLADILVYFIVPDNIFLVTSPVRSH